MCNKEKETKCCVCGEEHSPDKLKKVEIKGKVKNICEECLETIHGLV